MARASYLLSSYSVLQGKDRIAESTSIWPLFLLLWDFLGARTIFPLRMNVIPTPQQDWVRM